jgi:hypothetical protein
MVPGRVDPLVLDHLRTLTDAGSVTDTAPGGHA